MAIDIPAGSESVANGGRCSCSQCGEPNRAGARFCRKCGGALPEVESCPACGAPVTLESTVCFSCGLTFDQTEVDDTSEGIIGATVDDDEEEGTGGRHSGEESGPILMDIEGICPACQEPVSEDAESCSSCGLTLDLEGPGAGPTGLCPTCAIPLDVETELCPKCRR